MIYAQRVGRRNYEQPLMCIVEKLFRDLVALVFMLRWLKLDADTVTSAV